MERTIKNIKDIINYIEEVAKQQGVKRAELEKKCSLSQGMISRWKSEKYGPSIEKLMKIFKVLNIRVNLDSDIEESLLCPDQTVILESELLEQKIQDHLLKEELDSDTSKLISKILFSKSVTLRDKKKISKTLNYLVMLEEMREFYKE